MPALRFRRQQAFTLIEVLVASVILFSSIAVISMLYQGVLVSSQKAQQHIQLSASVPFILESVQREIRLAPTNTDGELNGQGLYWGVVYQWQAKRVLVKPPPVNFDPDSGNMVEHDDKYIMWEVTLNLEFKNVSKEFIYNELSWRDE